MAVDEALARTLSEGEAVLRIYRWRRPTLSFGRHQPAAASYDPLAMRALGVEGVRRPTGGREVLHDRELTYAVILPLTSPRSLRAVYRAVHAGLLDGLRALGVPAELAGSRVVPALETGPCFGTPAGGEVIAGGRKLVGSAQVRVGRTLLQHGSLLLGPPSVALESLHGPPGGEWGGEDGTLPRHRDRVPGGARDRRSGPEETSREDPPWVTLGELLPRPVPFDRAQRAVEAGIAGAFGGSWARGEMPSAAAAAARRILSRYRSEAWTWRR